MSRFDTPAASPAGEHDRAVAKGEVLARVGLVGRSEPFQRMISEIERLAKIDVLVLLQGATGTGKELAARAIHYLGARSACPFVPVDCGALPEALFEGEVFGHARGAFTDARREMRGLAAQAEKGTLFIDEVHTLSKRSQGALLRFLQDRSYRPLGSERLYRADVRIIAAANCSLEQAVAEGAFRADLFYRLSVATIDLPNLCDRAEDIPLLASDFLTKLASRYNRPKRHFDDAALGWLAARPWPGNVRELEHFVHREFLRSDERTITLQDSIVATEARARPVRPFNVERAKALTRFEVQYVRMLLAATRGNVSEAARRAGKDRRVFGRLMKKYQIDRNDFGKGWSAPPGV
jgi:two-component system response regulator GlrR